MSSVQTEILHHGDDRRRHHGAINTPVYRASLFSFPTYQDHIDARQTPDPPFIYTRVSNPTRAALESKIALLERTDRAIAFSSGMGAITCALLSFVKSGDHVLMVDMAYGPTRQFSDGVLGRLGVEVEYFASSESADLAGRIRPNTRVIYLESPSSLAFQIQDIRAVTRLAQAHNIITIIDNSWATPLYQQPTTMGVDIVLHSGTKYISGHSDVVVGLLACNEETYRVVAPMAEMLGACLSPDDAYLVTRGLRTLSVRLAHQSAAGLRIANWLRERPEVETVLHPGLPDFPDYELGRSQMQGYSSLFSIRLRPGTVAGQHAFVDSLRYFSIVISWGGFESLIAPGGRRNDDGETLALESYRICIGLEDVDDLIADLEQALAARAQQLG